MTNHHIYDMNISVESDKHVDDKEDNPQQMGNEAIPYKLV